MTSFFRNKFTPKKTPQRRSYSLSNLDPSQLKRDFGPEGGPVKLKLGGNEITFENGMWIQETGNGGSSHKEVMKLRKQNQTLSEENNLLKLKMEILLDMLAEATADVHLQENELTELKSMIKSRKR